MKSTGKTCRAKKKYLSPIRLSRTAWYYEERHGITVVAEERQPDGTLVAVIQTKIPWAKLEATMKRRERRRNRE